MPGSLTEITGKGRKKEKEIPRCRAQIICLRKNTIYGVKIYNGEFDPGSERTLAARFKHASRTVERCLHLLRVANG